LEVGRKAMIDEKWAVISDINKSRKQGREVITQYSGAMKEMFTV
jgi:hypothetical protein